jgi:hypothetical protein
VLTRKVVFMVDNSRSGATLAPLGPDRLAPYLSLEVRSGEIRAPHQHLSRLCGAH